VPGLTVAENVYLGVEATTAGFVRRRESRRRFRELAKTWDLICRRIVAGGLSIADQQKVEIMRALSRNASIVVMDEPTAALRETRPPPSTRSSGPWRVMASPSF